MVRGIEMTAINGFRAVNAVEKVAEASRQEGKSLPESAWIQVSVARGIEYYRGE
jgi:hypothetical protein